MPTFPFIQVDAFTSVAFAGNPAAVMLMPASGTDDALLQKIAAENNLSETCYVQPISSDAGDAVEVGERFGLRWFTPTCEVDLCGHGTLATAAALFTVAANPARAITFATRSGDLVARRDSESEDDAGRRRIWLDFPANPPIELERDAGFAEFGDLIRAALSGLLGEENSAEELVARIAYSAATRKLIVLLRATGEASLALLRPDTGALRATHDGSRVRGVAITAEAADATEFAFYSRYFAPWNGIPEDPVTGSLHTVLAPFWAATFEARTGGGDGGRRAPTMSLCARQCSPRGGTLRLKLPAERPISSEQRVQIGGDAVCVIRGTMEV